MKHFLGILFKGDNDDVEMTLDWSCTLTCEVKLMMVGIGS